MPKWMNILTGLLLAVAAAYFVMIVPKTSIHLSAPQVPENPVKFEVSRPQIKLVMEKKDEQWRLTAPVDSPADQNALKNFLSDLNSLELYFPLTRREKTYPLYQINESSAIFVRVWHARSDQPIEWIFGKRAKGTDLFVRLPDSPEVYLAGNVRHWELTRLIKEWRDRRIVPLAAGEEMHDVQINNNGKKIRFFKVSGQWRKQGMAADPEKIHQFISALQKLKTDEFVDTPEDFEIRAWHLPSTRYTLLITLNTGEKLEYRAGKIDKKNECFLLQKTNMKTIFWLEQHKRETIFP